MGPKREYASDATSVGEAEAALEAEGYTGQFAAAEDGEVTCFSCHTRSHADKVHFDAMYRTEGASDPDDMTAVCALVCPNCETKGTLVLKYGPESTLEEQDVLRALEDRRNSSSGGVSSMERGG